MGFQEEIKERWEDSAEGYDSGIQKELNGAKKEAWKKLIYNYAPTIDKMKILDIGTGPGFFPVILGEDGHDITGIDLTDNMLKYARKNAENYGVKAEFKKMNCQKLDFEDDTFDMIICRNLTWTLIEPEKCYEEWYRVLKPDGRLLIFDANWNRYLFDDESKKRHDELIERVRKRFGAATHDHCNQDEMEEEGRRLPMGSHNRPVWDLGVFIEKECKKVFAHMDISKVIPFDEIEKMEMEMSPMFLVGAEK